jgi:hypothetical protein
MLLKLRSEVRHEFIHIHNVQRIYLGLLAAFVGQLAEKKGLNATLWNVFFPDLTPLLGSLFVALLPSASQLAPVAYRGCLHCSRTVKAGIEVCPYCHDQTSGEPKIRRKWLPKQKGGTMAGQDVRNAKRFLPAASCS